MPVETGSYIDDFDSANPPGTDLPKEGDDHLRLIKNWMQNSLPSMSAPVSLIPQTSTGVGNDYILTLDPAPSTLTAGMVVYFVADKTNTAAPQLTINSISVDVYIGESEAIAGDIQSGVYYRCAYDGIYWQLVQDAQVVSSRDVFTYANVNAIGSPTSTQNVDWTTHDFQTVIHDKNLTLTFTPPVGTSTSLILLLVPDGSINRSLTFPANVLVTNGSYSVNTVANAYDLIEMAYDGTNYYARVYEAMRAP